MALTDRKPHEVALVVEGLGKRDKCWEAEVVVNVDIQRKFGGDSGGLGKRDIWETGVGREAGIPRENNGNTGV